jgi:hypothetical protein
MTFFSTHHHKLFHQHLLLQAFPSLSLIKQCLIHSLPFQAGLDQSFFSSPFSIDNSHSTSKMQYRIVFGVATCMAFGASAAPSPAITASPSLEERKLALKRDSLPASSGSSALSDVYTIAAGGSFDGGMYAFDRGVDCEGQTEGGDSDAVFQIEEGGTLSNVIIGPNQMEGVHCQGACTLTNVWWSAVCEDAFTIKNQDAGDTTYINGGGAFGADDKVFQHNGG